MKRSFSAANALPFLLCVVTRLWGQNDEDITTLYRKAQEALGRKEYAQAAEVWKRIVELNPGLAEARSNLGMMYHLQNLFDKSIPEFQTALKLNPRLTSARILLAIDYYFVSQPSRAISELDRVLLQEPKNHDAHQWLGMNYFQVGSFFKAAEQFRECEEGGFGNEETAFHLERAYQKLSQTEYQLVFRLAPDSVWEFILKADQYLIQNNTDQALDRLEHALQVAPGFPGIHLRRGQLFQAKGEMSRAFQEYLAEYVDHPTNARAVVSLIGLTFQCHLEDEAKALVEAAKIRFKSRTAILQQLASFASSPPGQANGTSCNLESSVIKAAQTLLEKDPPPGKTTPNWKETVNELLEEEEPQAAQRVLKAHESVGKINEKLYWEGRIWVAMGKSDKAIQPFVRLTALVPQQAEYHYYVGLCAEKLAFEGGRTFAEKYPQSYRIAQIQAEYFLARNEENKALEAYRQALIINPTASQMHQAMGNIYVGRADYENAITEYEAELRLDPYSRVSLEKLGQVFLLTHRLDKAVPPSNEFFK